MPVWKKGDRIPFPGDPNDPEGLVVWVRRYLVHQAVRNYSEVTIHTNEQALRWFVEWAFDRGIERPSEVTRPIIEAYQRWLFYYRRKNGHPLSYTTQRHRLTLLKGLFRYLIRQNAIVANPASDLELPRTTRRIPKAILSEREMERVLNEPDVEEPLGLRDRAMMEVLYSTGIRRHELRGLQLFDIDEARGTVLVRLGKGRKDRTVPIGERAVYWLRRYLDEVRPVLVVPPDLGVVFLSEHGDALTLGHLSLLMRDYLDAARIGKQGAVHIFRHSMATHLLEGGADLRSIQEMLGHAKLDTTEIYTRISITRLKTIHTACHPTAKLEARSSAAVESSSTKPNADAAGSGGELELHSTLEAEGLEEELVGDDAVPRERKKRRKLRAPARRPQ